MTSDIGIYLIFTFGILAGAILSNKEFRVKFFKGFRKFLGQIGQSADRVNKGYSSESDPSYHHRKENKEKEKEDRRNIRHVYEVKHKRVECSTCNGSGRVMKKVSPLMEGALGYRKETFICPECKGEKYVFD